MGLKGRLSSLPLVDVLKLIESKEHTGRLTLEGDRGRSVLYLDKGNLVFLSCLMDPVNVGLRLAWKGYLPRREYLGWRLAVARGQKSTTIDFYPGEGIPASAWQEVFEVALQDESLELFSWQDAEFEFETGSLSVPEGLRLKHSIETFLNQATSRVATWKQMQAQLPQDGSVPAIVDFLAPESLVGDVAPSEPEWRVLAHVDGRRDLRALASVSSLSYFDTCQGIANLVRKGFVQWAPCSNGDPVEKRIHQRLKDQGRGLLQRFTSKDKGAKSAGSETTISLIARFENRLLEQLEQEAEAKFDAEEFLKREWKSLWVRHPLFDAFPIPGKRLLSFRFEDEVSAWEDPQACEEVILDCLAALQELVEATYQEMFRALGEKRALQGYRKEYEQVLGSGLPGDVVQELSWLSLAR